MVSISTHQWNKFMWISKHIHNVVFLRNFEKFLKTFTKYKFVKFRRLAYHWFGNLPWQNTFTLMTFYEKNSHFKNIIWLWRYKTWKGKKNCLILKIWDIFFLTSTKISINPNFIEGDFKYIINNKITPFK